MKQQSLISLSNVNELDERLLDEEFNLIKQSIITRTNTYYDGTYHCSICGEHEVTSKDLKEIRAAHICKFCGNEVTRIARKPTEYIKYLVELPRENYKALYLCELINRELSTSWVGVETEKDLFVREIGSTMGYYIYKTTSQVWGSHTPMELSTTLVLFHLLIEVSTNH